MNNEPKPPPVRADSDLCRLFANFFLEGRNGKSFIDWAVRQLAERRDSPSLRILAGLSGNDSQETDFYLRRTFRELGIIVPEEKDCLLRHCGWLTRQILIDQVRPGTGYNQIYRVSLHLGHPPELLRWLRLEADLYPHEEAPDKDERLDALIRAEAVRFLGLMVSYERTGVLRLTTEESFQYLRSLSFDAPADASALPAAMPSATDDGAGLSFFRASLDRVSLDYLTIPRTFFGRSKIKSVTFEYSDLSESRMCWSDWEFCYFAGANLARCDLRRSVFEHCYFQDVDLSGADLRGARFEKCSFSNAVMKGTKLEKRFGFSRWLASRRLMLSPEQTREIDWTNTRGPDPEGG